MPYSEKRIAWRVELTAFAMLGGDLSGLKEHPVSTTALYDEPFADLNSLVMSSLREDALALTSFDTMRVPPDRLYVDVYAWICAITTLQTMSIRGNIRSPARSAQPVVRESITML